MNRIKKAMALAMMIVWLLPLAGPGQAQELESQPDLSIDYTAHCLCRVQTPGGSVVKDFGTIAAYTGLFPQNGTHQAMCQQACIKDFDTLLQNQGAACDAFVKSGGAPLVAYYKLGSRDWTDTGTATEASIFGYPQSCYGASGYVEPAYYILTMVYAPPGCTILPATPAQVAAGQPNYKCSSPSNVTYGSGSTTGTTTSTSNSFAKGVSVTASFGVPGGDGATALGVTGSFGYQATNTDGESETISKTTSNTIAWPSAGGGPVSNDGVNDDFDIVILLLNPAVLLNSWRDPVTGQTYIQWTMGYTGPQPEPQQVEVAHLRCALAGYGPHPAPTAMDAALGLPNSATYDPLGTCLSDATLQMPGAPDSDPSLPAGFLPGLTLSDYQQIIMQDPFWNNNPSFWPAGQPFPSSPPSPSAPRFTPGNFSGWYDPGTDGMYGNECLSQGSTQTLSNADTYTTSTAQSYMASLKATYSSLILSGTWTWTSQTSQSNNNVNSQTATALVTCSSSNWTGPTQFVTYHDNLYGTNVFVLEPSSYFSARRLLSTGRVVDTSGEPEAGVPVELVVRAVTYYSFTNIDGDFVFYAPNSGTRLPSTAKLSVGAADSICGAVTETVIVGESAPVVLPCLRLTVATNPTGLEASIGAGGPYAPAPISQQVPVNQTQVISVTSPQFVAASGTGYSFTNWSTGGSTPLTTVQPASNLTATANFEVACYALTVNAQPASSGSVALSPASGGLTGLPPNCYAPGTVVTLTATSASGNLFQSWTGASGTSNTTTVTVNAASTVTANFAQPPVLTVFLQSRASGSANLSMGVTNSGATTATNVTVTAITGITGTGATFVYNPGLLVVPFIIPGAASMSPGSTSGFNLDFTATSGNAGAPFSFVIAVKADNVPAFSTTVNVP